MSCRHGIDVLDAARGLCPGCRSEVEAGCQRFDQLVAEGVYNVRGFTKREWIAAGYKAEHWQAAIRDEREASWS